MLFGSVGKVSALCPRHGLCCAALSYISVLLRVRHLLFLVVRGHMPNCVSSLVETFSLMD